ncbi:MAG: hypothetical protein LBR74_01080 [Eubacterium sp.]|jgi:hypothetical protein|nr:hypothetical protein [Eubacterium sp.]
MKKQYLAVGAFLIALIGTITLGGCKDNYEYDSEERLEQETPELTIVGDIAGSGVEIVPYGVEGPVTEGEVILEVSDVSAYEAVSIAYTVTNLSGQSLRHGDMVSLYYDNQGEWEEVSLPDDFSWDSLGEEVIAGGTDSGEIELGGILEELPEGTYRLEKEFYSGEETINPTDEFNIFYMK